MIFPALEEDVSGIASEYLRLMNRQFENKPKGNCKALVSVFLISIFMG